MTEQSAAASSNQQQAAPPRPPVRRGLTALIVALVGGALTAGAIVLVSANNSTGATSDLSIVAAADIGAAAQTMDPTAAQLATGARNCSVPLARVTIAMLPGASGGTVRIRSASYLSPPFQLTNVPQQVAIPFPAPYPVGAGTIGVEGNATGVVISLRPGWTIPTLDGAAVRTVTWRVGSPCQ
jgi:hypothetical protein